MGQVVQLPRPIERNNELARALAREARLRTLVKTLRANNKILIKLLQDPHNEHIRLLNAQMRRDTERMRQCTCTPERSDYLRGR